MQTPLLLAYTVFLVLVLNVFGSIGTIFCAFVYSSSKASCTFVALIPLLVLSYDT